MYRASEDEGGRTAEQSSGPVGSASSDTRGSEPPLKLSAPPSPLPRQ